ncbi:MAG: sel1 repeat family protein [Verrucomicrobia bacterium]|nr:sel1 repeat family protein [Verrucomicrobiota bacterium]
MKAHSTFQKAASLVICCFLGGLVAGGQEKTSQVKTFEYMIRRAEEGDAGMQFTVGFKYLHGDTVTQDFAKAFSWFSKSAAQGFLAGQASLADCYRYGRGVPQNKAIADAILLKLANEGDALMQRSLGLAFEGEMVRKGWTYRVSGEFVPLAIQAYKWYSLAATQGEASAAKDRNELAAAMDPKDLAAAQRLAAEFKPAEKTPWPVPPRPPTEEEKAAEIKKLQAEKEKKEAAMEKMKATQAKVLALQMRQASNGSATFQFDLGARYLKGDGVEKNEDLAREWLEKSAAQGNNQAKALLETTKQKSDPLLKK